MANNVKKAKTPGKGFLIAAAAALGVAIIAVILLITVSGVKFDANTFTALFYDIFHVWGKTNLVLMAILGLGTVVSIFLLIWLLAKHRGVMLFAPLILFIDTVLAEYALYLFRGVLGGTVFGTKVRVFILLLGLAVVVSIIALIFALLPFVAKGEPAVVEAPKEEEPKETISEDRVREIAREEIANAEKEEKQQPIVVNVNTAAAPVEEKEEEKEEEQPAVVKAEPAPEPEKEEEPVEEPVEEAVEEPVEEPAPADDDAPEADGDADGGDAERKKRVPFAERLENADPDLKAKYDELSDYIRSYGIKNRVSIPGDTFSAHRERYVFLTITGKHIKAYFALDPASYYGSPIPVNESSSKKYDDLKVVLRVKSDLSLKRAKKLVDDVMAAKGVTKPE